MKEIMVSDAARAKWLEERRKGIGGSDAAVIAGLSPWKSAYSLWVDKVHGATTPSSEVMEWGNRLEPVIFEHYAKQTGRDLSPGTEMVRSDQHPFLYANTDGFITADCDGKPFDEGVGILEIKTSARKSDWDAHPPAYYLCQVQHYMLVHDLQWADFAVLFNGREFKTYRVDRNDDFLESYVRQARQFWDLVESQTPPESMGGSWAQEEANALAHAFPGDVSLDAIELDEATVESHIALTELKTRKKTLLDEIKSHENAIKRFMGDHTTGLLPDGSSYSLNRVHRGEYTVSARSYRELRYRKSR